MKKILILTTTLAMFTTLNANDTLNTLVEKKIQREPLASVSISRGVGKILKMTLDAFMERGKLIPRMPAEYLNEATQNVLKGFLKKRYDEITISEALGYALFKELELMKITFPKNLNAAERGYRAKRIFDGLGENIVYKKKHLEDLYYLSGEIENNKAHFLLTTNKYKDRGIEGLANQVRIMLNSQGYNKANRRFGIKL